MRAEDALQQAKSYVKKSLAGAGALKGEKGEKGDKGESAYEIAKNNGFEGTESEWLESLKGKDGNSGNATEDDIDSFSIEDNAGAHNCIYRGKYLGESVTDEHYESISSGTFKDLFIGDYWTISGVNYRIAAFDYYLNCGDTSCDTHHAVIVPDTSFYTAPMNSSNTTSGGYVGSLMYKSNLSDAKSIIKSAFSGHVLSHRIYLTNAVSNGRPSAGAWCDSEVDLMCEEMVNGTGIFRPTSDGANVPFNYRVEKSQLPLFAHEPRRICNRTTWWLRDVVSASSFAYASRDGGAYYGNASYSLGVRPAFCIS